MSELLLSSVLLNDRGFDGIFSNRCHRFGFLHCLWLNGLLNRGGFSCLRRSWLFNSHFSGLGFFNSLVAGLGLLGSGLLSCSVLGTAILAESRLIGGRFGLLSNGNGFFNCLLYLRYFRRNCFLGSSSFGGLGDGHLFVSLLSGGRNGFLGRFDSGRLFSCSFDLGRFPRRFRDGRVSSRCLWRLGSNRSFILGLSSLFLDCFDMGVVCWFLGNGVFLNLWFFSLWRYRRLFARGSLFSRRSFSDDFRDYGFAYFRWLGRLFSNSLLSDRLVSQSFGRSFILNRFFDVGCNRGFWCTFDSRLFLGRLHGRKSLTRRFLADWVLSRLHCSSGLFRWCFELCGRCLLNSRFFDCLWLRFFGGYHLSGLVLSWFLGLLGWGRLNSRLITDKFLGRSLSSGRHLRMCLSLLAGDFFGGCQFGRGFLC